MNQRKIFGIAWLLVAFLLAGSLFAFAGVVYALAPDTDLSSADASFWGEDADDRSGYSVACAGDVNGDGYDDFLIGAIYDEDGGTQAGQTYLILGRAAADWGMDFDLSNADASFWGEDSYDLSGHSVASAGDVNGDGRDDFLIGALGDDDGGDRAGQTYLILGRAAADWGMDFDLSDADASFWGEDWDGESGRSVASAGDVNGDGRDDFLIGALGDDDGGDRAGQTYLILGRAAADWGMDFDLSNADASFWGEDSYDLSGHSVAPAGDVNGDGYDDFLIGAYYDDDGGSAAGQTYLILGRAAADWGMDFDLSNADASFWGEDSSDLSGRSVASAGDVNGDGYDDFLIGAPQDDDGAAYAGQTYLILGSAAADWGMDFDLSSADASFWGEDSDDRSGYSVASAGDVNGDGRDDFLIGAIYDEDGGDNAGQTYLILGSAAADWGMDFDLSDADASFWGEDAYDHSGSSVACAGDVNGDGYDDFLIGAYGDDGGGTNAGQTYLLLGTPPPVQYDLTISGTVGGSITTPGEGNFTYDEGTVVALVASPDVGYYFVNWDGDVGTIADVEAASTNITMSGNYSITANFEEEEVPMVTTQAATNITTSSATLNMAYTVGDFSPVEVRFAYKESTDSAWSYTAWVSKAVDGTYATLLNGLSSSTKYDFKAQLKYNDTVIEGATLQFTTSTISGCFIATAAYGTPTTEQLDVLREFRDVVLLESNVGSKFVALYYQLSPPVADFISGSSFLRTLVRELLVDPIVWIVEATGDMWRN